MHDSGMHEYEMQTELDWSHGRIEQLEEEISDLYRRIHELEEQRNRERDRSDRYFAENGKIIAEVMGLRVENERLLKLIQAQDKLIRASDTAAEIKLADKLAEVLQKVDTPSSTASAQTVHQVLNEWKTARDVDFEDKTMDSGKRVS